MALPAKTAERKVFDQERLAKLATEINAEHTAFLKSATDAIGHAIETGRCLEEAKSQLPHGQWSGWVAENCSFGDRQASNYMRAFHNRAEIEAQIGSTASDLTSLHGAISALASPDSPALPWGKRMAKPLARLPECERAAAWDQAVKAAGGKPTIQDVELVVNHRIVASKVAALPPGVAAGKTLVNGVLEDDPDVVVELRAKGRTPVTSTVVVDNPDPNVIDAQQEAGESEAERAAIQEEAETDEEWLAKLPLASRLTGHCLRKFRQDALTYKRIHAEVKRFRHAVVIVLNQIEGRKFVWSRPYEYVLTSPFRVEPPDKWRLCPPPDTGGCGGTGVVFGDECIKCHGHGYVLR